MKFDLHNAFAAAKLAVCKHSPAILAWTGAVTGIGGAVLAGVATRKLDTALASHAERTERARNTEDEKERKKELTRAYAKTCAEIGLLYLPAALTEAVSVSAIFIGNHILTKRFSALTAAYAALDAGFRQYRKRVVERYGEDADKQLRLGVGEEKIELEEDGKKLKKKALVSDGGTSEYGRVFAVGDSKAAEYSDDHNKFFLRGQQELANNMLRATGYLFLNEVYDMLGYERSVAGQIVGWIYDKNKSGNGDNYVDFGITESYRLKDDGSGEYEKIYLLDFNVDGPILTNAKERGLLTE